MVIALSICCFFLFCTIIVLLLLLDAVKQSDREADQLIDHMQLVIKGLLVQQRKEYIFLPDCYLFQASDVKLKFRAVKDGLDLCLVQGRSPRETN